MDAVLEGLKGVNDAKASFFTKLVQVEYDPEEISPEEMINALNSQTGYRASLPAPPPARLRLKVPGLVRPGQVFQLRRSLTRLEGVLDADLRLGAASIGVGEATIDYDPARVSPEELKAFFARNGLRTQPAEATPGVPEVEVLPLRLLGLKGPRDIFMPGQILGMIPGILDVEFKPDRRLDITYDAKKLAQESLVALLDQMELQPTVLSADDHRRGTSAWLRAKVDGLWSPRDNVRAGYRLFIERGILDIRLKPGRVELLYDPKRTSPEALLAILNKLKLKPTLLRP